MILYNLSKPVKDYGSRMEVRSWKLRPVAHVNTPYDSTDLLDN